MADPSIMPAPSPEMAQTKKAQPLGFWACWSLTAGIMIGSGIFLLPSILAPFGMMSFAGWSLTTLGSIAIALVIARLSSRTKRSGGVYIYAQDSFGDLTGFLIAWGYWAAYCISIPAIAIAFVGYFAVFFPSVETSLRGQALTALALIWVLTFINMRSLKGTGFLQILMTLLKIIPLLLIIALGFIAGEQANLPQINPSQGSVISIMATTALLTMWAFSGLEAGTIPASNVKNPQKTIPRAIIIGTLSVAFIYIASTYAVMRLVPSEVLIGSTSPFAEAATALGSWGPPLIAIGAMIATAGSLNGVIFVAGQMPMALAIDGMAPKIFLQKDPAKPPQTSLILGSFLGSLLLAANNTKGLIDAFTFLAMMGTLSVLVPLLVSAAAEFLHSYKPAKFWAVIALLAGIYSLFAIFGSGLTVILWGLVLMLCGLPVYFWLKRNAENLS